MAVLVPRAVVSSYLMPSLSVEFSSQEFTGMYPVTMTMKQDSLSLV